jgi:hypothetical protein
MERVHDYESQAITGIRLSSCIAETYAGTAIVGWHGKIEGQLVNHIADAEKGRNFVYADKLREYLKIWRANEITGSINRETLETLKAASDMLAVDNWTLDSYFRSLSIHLKVLIASEEQLPRGVDMNQNDPMAGGGGGGRGAPPMSPTFGAQKEPEAGAEGLPGGAVAGGGAGGGGGLGASTDPNAQPGAEEMPGAEPGQGAIGPDGKLLPPGAEGQPGEENAGEPEVEKPEDEEELRRI